MPVMLHALIVVSLASCLVTGWSPRWSLFGPGFLLVHRGFIKGGDSVAVRGGDLSGGRRWRCGTLW